MILEGSFTAPGQSAVVGIRHGSFKLAIWGTFDGAITLENAPDGTNYVPADDAITAPGTWNGNEVAGQASGSETPYRLNAGALSSGEAFYRLEQAS